MKTPLVRLADGRELLIRQCDEGDASELLEFADAVGGESDYLSFGTGQFGVSLEQEREIIRKIRAADNRLLLLAIVGGRIVGNLIFSGGHRPRIRHRGDVGMTVRKDFWGIGIGSRLMDALLDWARCSGVVTKLDLQVRTDNERAQRLYRGKGFVLEGTLSRQLQIDGRYYDHHCLGFELPLP